jgi:hypothetical protein
MGAISDSAELVPTEHGIDVREQKLDAGGRQRLRRQRSKPIAETLRQWLIRQRGQVPDDSAGAKAVEYSQGRWAALIPIELVRFSTSASSARSSSPGTTGDCCRSASACPVYAAPPRSHKHLTPRGTVRPRVFYENREKMLKALSVLGSWRAASVRTARTPVGKLAIT